MAGAQNDDQKRIEELKARSQVLEQQLEEARRIRQAVAEHLRHIRPGSAHEQFVERRKKPR